MSDLTRINPVVFAPGVNDVQQSFGKDDDDIRNIYLILNSLRGWYKSGTPPTSPNVGDIWRDSSVTPSVPKEWNGTAWVVIDFLNLPLKNLLINSGFAVNNGNAGTPYVSGAALTSGQHGHDMVKAGTGGLTYTFTQSAGSVTPITITAGSAILPIESKSILGGNYTVSWVGTAQCRVNGGTYGTSPLTVTGITTGTQLNVEFNTGTLSYPKVNTGNVATPYYADDYQSVLIQCMRYARIIILDSVRFLSTAAGTSGSSSNQISPMYSTPTYTFISTTVANNVTSVVATALSNTCIRFSVVATSSGDTYRQDVGFLQSRL